MAARLQFEANLLGEVAPVFDDQNGAPASVSIGGLLTLSKGGLTTA